MDALYDITGNRYLINAKSFRMGLNWGLFQVYIDSPNPIPTINDIIKFEVEDDFELNTDLYEIFNEQTIKDNIIRMQVLDVIVIDQNEQFFSICVKPAYTVRRILVERIKQQLEYKY